MEIMEYTCKNMKKLDEMKKEIGTKLNERKERKLEKYNLEIVEEALISNEYNLNEFDWNTTLKFISNRNNFSFGNVIKLYEDRSYKIKNLIKELPTYVVLYKRQRQINGIEEDLCLRCNKFREDWEHVWLCEANEEEVSAMIKNAVYEYELKLIEEKKKEEAEIVRDINFEFIRILEKTSVVLIGKNREWELLGGVYNHNFN
ncbi:unnamed protein product [Rhizophagus irregularis]|nr:unnamed protein product [Rhizophagus irregularis]